MSDNGDVSPVGLVACSDLNQYRLVGERAGAHEHIPFIDSMLGRQVLSRARLSDQIIAFKDWSPHARRVHEPFDPPHGLARCCIGVGDPVAVAVAELVARVKRKRLWRAEGADDDVSGQLLSLERRLAASPAPASVTIVFPSWGNAAGHPGPGESLKRIVGMCRRVSAEIPIGLLTSRDPALLTAIVAKICARSFSPGPISVLGSASALPAPSLPLDLTRRGQTARAKRSSPPDTGVHYVEEEAVGQTVPDLLTHVAWSASVFCGHARPYCGFEGHCCAAKASAGGGECVQGLECFDAAWPKVDPRDLNASLVVFDACSALSVSDSAWAMSSAPIAVLALEGIAMAVISTAASTLSSHAAEALFAISTAATAGEAAVLLDECRRTCKGPAPRQFFLLGDPDQVLPEGWRAAIPRTSPSEVADSPAMEASATTPAASFADEAPADAPLVRIPLAAAAPDAAREQVFFVSGELTRHERGSAFLVRSGSTRELWLRRRVGAPPPSVRQFPTPALPPELVEHATALPSRLLSWRGLARNGVEGLLAACSDVVACERHLARLAGQATTEDFSRYVKVPVARWRRAHQDALAHVVNLRGQSLWTEDLMFRDRNMTACPEDACPYCGASPTIITTYRSFPAGLRTAQDCEHCGGSRDSPVAVHEVALVPAGPAEIRATESHVFALTVHNRSKTASASGAVALFIEGLPTRARGTAQPAVIPVTIPENEQIVVKATLGITSDATIPSHLYRLKAVGLIDGSWYFATRFIRISRA